MKLNDLPSSEGGRYQKSEMPIGGRPADDLTWIQWVKTWALTRHGRFCDRYSERFREVPDSLPFNSWQAESDLYAALIGWKFPDATGPTHNHRERFLAIQFHLRPGFITAWLDEWADAKEQAVFDERGRL